MTSQPKRMIKMIYRLDRPTCLRRLRGSGASKPNSLPMISTALSSSAFQWVCRATGPLLSSGAIARTRTWEGQELSGSSHGLMGSGASKPNSSPTMPNGMNLPTYKSRCQMTPRPSLSGPKTTRIQTGRMQVRPMSSNRRMESGISKPNSPPTMATPMTRSARESLCPAMAPPPLSEPSTTKIQTGLTKQPDTVGDRPTSSKRRIGGGVNKPSSPPTMVTRETNSVSRQYRVTEPPPLSGPATPRARDQLGSSGRPMGSGAKDPKSPPAMTTTLATVHSAD